jgi:ankyrin repeat protein
VLSTEMLAAARNGDVAAVKQLLAKGEDVNAANPDGVTALMIAGTVCSSISTGSAALK